MALKSAMAGLVPRLIFAALAAMCACSLGGDSSKKDQDRCAGVEGATAKVKLCYVIHNEEDDANGVEGSVPDIPDYNGDEAVFDHFADAMLDYAKMLLEHGATLSFQPDWTFTEGVKNFKPDFFKSLLALKTVEIVPHAHETVVPYDSLYRRLDELGAEPKNILGGMTFDKFLTKQDWLDANPGFAFWGAPTATAGHVDDKPAPPFAYRIPMPKDVSAIEDLYRHAAASSLIVTPGLPSSAPAMIEMKPEKRLISPAYVFHATREFLAEPDDESIPEKWRKRTDGSKPPFGGNLTAEELISSIEADLENDFLPLKEQGKLEFKTVGDVIEEYKQNESCLDLSDGQDLREYVEGGQGDGGSPGADGGTVEPVRCSETSECPADFICMKPPGVCAKRCRADADCPRNTPVPLRCDALRGACVPEQEPGRDGGAQPGRCGDGVCDEVEKANPDLCPDDCGGSQDEFGSREFQVTNPTSGVEWWCKAFYPLDAGPGNRYPAVVFVPGGSAAGSDEMFGLEL